MHSYNLMPLAKVLTMKERAHTSDILDIILEFIMFFR